MAAEDSNGIIIVTVGLPGAGKTTVCRWLVENLSSDCSLTCRLVCYDDALNDRLDWGRPDFCWKSERKTLYDEAARWLHDKLMDNGHSPDGEIVSSSMRRLWLIVDDNMYYRSMRYPYYQLAREFDDAVRRNEHRSIAHRVPADVIERMRSRLQEPSPETCAWEKVTIRVQGKHGINDSAVSDSVMTQLRHASRTPASPFSSIEEEEKERQRHITKSSLLHQADLTLRRVVSEYHQNGARKYPAALLVEAKRHLLESMKQGRLDVNVVVQQDIDTVRQVFGEFADTMSTRAIS